MGITSEILLILILFFLSFFLLLLSQFLRSISKAIRNHRDSTATIYQLFHDDIAKPAQNLVTTAERLELHKPERFSEEQWERLKKDFKKDRDRLTKQVHRLREVSMAEMLDQIELAKTYEVNLTNKELDSNKFIHANLIDFKNIISNIVENGIRYSDANKKDRFVAITTKIVLFGISIRIKDNGIGISSNKFKKIGREPVKRGANEIEGGGVGLFLIKKMADSNNIKIAVRSEVGVGTDITITKREIVPKFRFMKYRKL